MKAAARPSADLLATIVAATRRIVDTRRARVPAQDLERRSSSRTPGGQAFARALVRPGHLNVIAECKRRSPSRGVLRQDYDPVALARGYAAAGAAAISILTEPTFFDGALEHLVAVREAVTTPLLRKDFIVDRYQVLEARAAGADAILLVAGALPGRDLHVLIEEARSLDLATVVEVHDERELDVALDAGALIVGVNNRDLRTLQVSLDTSARLAARIPPDRTAVAESGLRTHDDLVRLSGLGYHAFLVGERLMVQPEPSAALRALVEGEPPPSPAEGGR